MELEERVKASLRRRADRELPDERVAWERISQRRVGTDRHALNRALVVAVALGISGATTALVVVAFSSEHENGPVPAANVVLPRVLTITCAGRETSADTSVVAAHADGVHVRLTGGPRPARLSFRGSERGRYSGLVKGDRGVVLPPPGTWRVVCSDATRPRTSGGGAQVKVIDQNGLWVDGEMVCQLSDLCNGIGTLRSGGGETVASIRRSVPGIQPGDVIERSGYPEAVEQGGYVERYRVVQDGRVIGSVTISGIKVGSNVVVPANATRTFWTARACKDTALGQALLHA